MFHFCLLLCCYLVVLLNSAYAKEYFHEELAISQLANKNMLYQFRFLITTAHESDHIPYIIRDIFERYELQELHFAITQGFWHTSLWGLPPEDEAPTGSYFLVLFKADSTKIDEKWNFLVNLLNGIFCTSILQMTPVLTSAPAITFGNGSSLNWRYGALGGEPVCTENLKSWKQLLPCKRSGLSTLLNPKELYGANYHSMSIRVSRSLDKHTDEWRFELASNLVKDLNLRTRLMDWSFSRDLGSSLIATCPISNSSQVIVETTGKEFTLEPQSNNTFKWKDREFTVYNTNEYTGKQNFNLRANYLASKLELGHYFPSLFSLHTYLQSVDQQGGKIATRIHNLDETPRNALFTHMIPWYLRIYLHTLAFVCNGARQEILNQRFSLAIDRQKPILIEFEIVLPPNSICEITYDYETAFLRLTEYPPDSNSGLFVPGPMLKLYLDEDTYAKNATVFGSFRLSTSERMQKNVTTSERVVTLHGEPLLILLPVPDFSMPFNVICFVCTAIALFYGPAHALTTKIMTPITDESLATESGLIRRLIASIRLKLKAKFGKDKKE